MTTRFGQLLQPLALLGIACLLLPAAGHAEQEEGYAWYSVGSAPVDDGGAWRFEVNASEDLLGAGLTLVRVTSAACDATPDQAIVFEARVRLTQAGDRSWEGQLMPTGSVALSLPPIDPTSGDVYLIPMLAGTRVVTGLDGVPPGGRLAVCLRQP